MTLDMTSYRLAEG